MHRRSFLTGLFGVAGAAAAGVAFTSSAEAAEKTPNLLDTLQGMDAGKIENPLIDEADMPAEGAQEAQFYIRRRPVRRVYVRPVVRRRVIVRRPRQRCVWVRSRGRLVRRCYWV
jgi:hypothetical protein